MNAKTMKVAFSAVVAALATVVMALAGIVPVATIALPALAGLFAIPVVYECGASWGFTMYAVVSVLSFFVTADREASLMYILFFGYYPILFALFGRVSKKVLRIVLKLLTFNAAMALETLAALYILKIPEDALFIGGGWGIVLMVALLNVLLFLYDYTIPGLVVLYGRKFHPIAARVLRLKK